MYSPQSGDRAQLWATANFRTRFPHRKEQGELAAVPAHARCPVRAAQMNWTAPPRIRLRPFHIVTISVLPGHDTDTAATSCDPYRTGALPTTICAFSMHVAPQRFAGGDETHLRTAARTTGRVNHSRGLHNCRSLLRFHHLTDGGRPEHTTLVPAQCQHRRTGPGTLVQLQLVRCADAVWTDAYLFSRPSPRTYTTFPVLGLVVSSVPTQGRHEAVCPSSAERRTDEPHRAWNRERSGRSRRCEGIAKQVHGRRPSLRRRCKQVRRGTTVHKRSIEAALGNRLRRTGLNGDEVNLPRNQGSVRLPGVPVPRARPHEKATGLSLADRVSPRAPPTAGNAISRLACHSSCFTRPCPSAVGLPGFVPIPGEFP
jgi:hypothetical protein